MARFPVASFGTGSAQIRRIDFSVLLTDSCLLVWPESSGWLIREPPSFPHSLTLCLAPCFPCTLLHCCVPARSQCRHLKHVFCTLGQLRNM